jgi:hypothetical protein
MYVKYTFIASKVEKIMVEIFYDNTGLKLQDIPKKNRDLSEEMI